MSYHTPREHRRGGGLPKKTGSRAGRAKQKRRVQRQQPVKIKPLHQPKHSGCGNKQQGAVGVGAQGSAPPKKKSGIPVGRLADRGVKL